MDIASIALHFLCAAVAGFLIMSIFGVQALVALCSSISLACLLYTSPSPRDRG